MVECAVWDREVARSNRAVPTEFWRMGPEGTGSNPLTKKMRKIFRIPKLQMALFLLLIFITAIIHYRLISHIQTFLIALLSTIIFDLAFLKLRRIELFFPYAAVVTGTIIGLATSLNLSWYQLVIAGVLAVLSKHYLKFGNRHVFNPAAFGLFFSHLVFGGNISWWAVSWQQFIPQNPQFIIYPLILLLPGLVSAVRLRRFVNILAFYLVYGLFTKIIFDPTVIFFSLVMLPEPMTTPHKFTEQILFGIFIAFLSFIIRLPLPDIFIPALLLGNLVFFCFRCIIKKRFPPPLRGGSLILARGGDSMNKNIFIAAIVILVLIGGVALLKIYNTPTTEPTTSSSSTNTEVKEEVIITYTETGFSPSEAILKNGGRITWVNKSNKEVKIGANPHPIHTGNREVSGGEFTLDLKPADQKTVVVSKVGAFGYHNHLNAAEGGTIVVK